MNKNNWVWLGIGVVAGYWALPRLMGAIGEI